VALLLAGLAFSITLAVGQASRLSDDAAQASLPRGNPSWLQTARAWFRRGRRALFRGMAAAAIPCVVSVAFYAAGILPTWRNMTLVGLVLGAAYVLARVALRRAPVSPAALAPVFLATVAASAVIGLMY
jgi:hypothetical protein